MKSSTYKASNTLTCCECSIEWQSQVRVTCDDGKFRCKRCRKKKEYRRHREKYLAREKAKYDPIKKSKYNKKYRESEKGKEIRRYHHKKEYKSEKGKATRKRWAQSEKGIKSRRERDNKYWKEKKPYKLKATYSPHAKARQFIAHCWRRIEKYNFDLAKIRRIESKEMSKILLEISKKQPTCQYCGTSQNLTWDHIIPLSKGGDPFSKDNLQRLCMKCNLSKGAKI